MSIIIQYKTEEQALDESKTGQLLNDEMLNILKLSVTDKEKMSGISINLAKILQVDSLPPQVINILIRPWYRANMLASWFNQANWSSEKDKARDYLDVIDKFEKMLKRDPLNINKLMLFITSSELDTNGLLLTLNELKEFFNIFLNLEFQNGKACSSLYFIRYAINSLFYMAKQMRLKGTGKPPQLSKYMAIITERDYFVINKDHHTFRVKDFLKEFDKNRNIPLWYIYNPYCQITNELLTQIRLSHKPLPR